MLAIKAPKKLIEVALPLDDINAAAAYEKLPGIGAHPRGIHQWWARRPHSAARAILFAQLVNDPGGERGFYPGKSKEQALHEREDLLDIARKLANWRNSDDTELLERARVAISRSWRETCELNRGQREFDPERPPEFHDPFSGGGTIPLEAQRLGLVAHASDLNPLAVVINKAMIEFPSRFAGRSPVGPTSTGGVDVFSTYTGVQGLAEDIQRYGALVLDEANKRLGHLYPAVYLRTGLPCPNGGRKNESSIVIAWIWVRTVRSPNPAYSRVDVPLASSFQLSDKPGREVWVEPVISDGTYHFEVRNAEQYGTPPAKAKQGTKAGRKGFYCLMSGSPITFEYVRNEGKAGRVGQRLMAVVAEGQRGKYYLSPTPEMERAAATPRPADIPETLLPDRALGFRVQEYGMTKHSDLFTNRQLTALKALADIVSDARDRIRRDALEKGWPDDGVGVEAGGSGATAYGDAVAAYLSLSLGRCCDFNNALNHWSPSNEKVMNLCSRQVVPMVWDFAEANLLGRAVGAWQTVVAYQSECVLTLLPGLEGEALQADAQTQSITEGRVVSTDPPYYDNIGYADLSDFFYVWERLVLKPIFPVLFGTMLTPKDAELVADPFRHGDELAAEAFFLSGMKAAMTNLVARAHPAFPVTIYYAFKQSDTTNNETASKGWEAFLEAVLRAGMCITGTWPLRSEQQTRIRSLNSNALASSIVLVCRKRDPKAPTVSRREFIRELKGVLPAALSDMTRGVEGRSPVAAVDLAQAIIGPGMAVFSQYAAVLEAHGEPMTVHTALTLINSYLPGDPDEFDADTRFCLAWFEECGWSAGQYGQADVLARAKGTSVDHIASAGVAEASGGRVRLLCSWEYPSEWTPDIDRAAPIWEATHQMIRALRGGGETDAGVLLARMPERSEQIRQLAYRLYALCERMGRAEEARAYDELIDAWSGVEQISYDIGRRGEQITFGGTGGGVDR